jgi:ribosomal protein S18 acetylase RimI-like enzyme
MRIRIAAITDNDRNVISGHMKTLWKDDIVIAHGEIFDTRNLPGFKAVRDNQIVGFAHYQFRGAECEIITLASFEEEKGIGSALIAAVEEVAKIENRRILSLITTNDNLHALGFYQRRGFRLAKLSPGQIKESRKLKPSIPEIGNHQIPIRDEIRLEKVLE